MSLNQSLNGSVAFVGALIGAAITIGLYLLGGIGIFMLAILGALVLIAYIVCTATAGGNASQEPGLSAFMRGLMIGVNALLNAFFAWLIIGALLGSTAGLVWAIAAGLVVFLAAIVPVSQSSIYQGFLGWLIWFLPMSWLVLAIGLLFFVLTLLLFIITLGKVDFLKITGFRMKPEVCAFLTKGGLFGNLNPLGTAYSMGNFVFVAHSDSDSDWHTGHETGHALSLAAFGFLYHFIGAIDENVIGMREHAFAERIANSHSNLSDSINMWKP